MVKSKKALQEENLQGAAPVEAQEGAPAASDAAEAPAQEAEAGEEAAAEPAAEPEAPAEEAADPIRLIILAYPGTESLMSRVWAKNVDAPFRIIPFEEGDPLISILEDVIAMNDVDRVFAVAPANLVPCAPISWDELQLPRVDVLKQDSLLYWGRVPVCFDKELLVDNLPVDDELDDESFVRAYVKMFYAGRPEQVSHSFGNYIVKVLRGTPCESVVIEGLMHKRFLYANAVGWAAVADLIEKALLG
jgi:hypothetical protein